MAWIDRIARALDVADDQVNAFALGFPNEQRTEGDFPVLIVWFRMGDSHGEAVGVRSGAFKDDFLLDVQHVPGCSLRLYTPVTLPTARPAELATRVPIFSVGGDPGSCAIAAFVYAAIPDASIDQKGG